VEQFVTKFPRPHRYDSLNAHGQRLARIPRYARLMARLPKIFFRDDQPISPAAIFWHAYTYADDTHGDGREETGLLDDGLKAKEAKKLGIHGEEPDDHPDITIRRWQVRLALDMLSAIAFEMFCGQDGQGASAPLYEVPSQDNQSLHLDEFLIRSFNRLRTAHKQVGDRELYAYGNSLGDPIKDPNATKIRADWKRLKAMDSHGLHYFVFSDATEVLKFNDVSTQRFFAACWACRWANDADRQMMRQWIPDPISDANNEYVEFWQMVAEMPEEAIDRKKWESLLSPLYDGTLQDENGLPIRSTELIYRTWDRMEGTAACQRFQSEFAELLKTNRVAQDLVSGFISLGKKIHGEKVDDGTFDMGAPADECPDWDSETRKVGGEDVVVQHNPVHRVSLKPYQLAATCVTNVEYELFDDRRGSRREFVEPAGERRNVDEHPVVNVSWYDAWCFAKWLGAVSIEGVRHEICLPTEAQWEYACRCGQSTPITWEAGRSGDKIESSYCNFDGNYPWAKPGTSKASKGPYRKRTINVDAFAANPWGFYQMHGNVWEWCHDRYAKDYYDEPAADVAPQSPNQALARVLRGGSWIYLGGRCRSGNRYGLNPGVRYGYNGFRVAAVLRSQA
jgi:formylglycine-generating enzyme required for sulfatase activity